MSEQTPDKLPETDQPATPDRPATAEKKRSLGKRLLLALVSTLVTVGLAELVLRLADFKYQLYPEKVEFGTPTPEQIESGFLVDQDLLWVTKDYFQRLDAARAKRPNVVFLGDSCTEWGNYERYFHGLVQQYLPNADYSYASLGCPAWTSYQGMRQLERDVLALQPRVVTIYFGWNDHWKGFGIQDKEVGFVNSSKLFQMQKHSRLAQLLTKAWVGATSDDSGPLRRVSPDDFRHNLTEMAQKAKAAGIAVVLITAPTSHEKGREPEYLKLRHMDDLSELVPVHQQYVQIVREVAEREGAVLCDLERVFARFDDERRRTKLFEKDGIHLTDEGDQVIAVELYQCFEQHGLLQRMLR